MSNNDIKNTVDKILETGRAQSVFRAADIRGAGDPRSTLRRLIAQKKLVQVGPGLFALPDADVSIHHALAAAVKRYPGGVICLISALSFYGIGTQIPYETWMMRHDRKAPPKEERTVRFVYSSVPAFFYGIAEYQVEGVAVQMYTPAKTVADCFKYRNKIGMEIALESLRESWRNGLFTMDELWQAAKVCRIQKIIHPYLEMLA